MKRWLWLLLAPALLAGCGFHFPGSAGRMPPGLKVLRVGVLDSPLRDPPLLLDLKRALAGAGVQVVGAGHPGVPTLLLSGETFVPQVLAVDTAGRVSAYLLDYALTFQLQDAAGKTVIAPRAVKLQRQYTFNIVNVLGEQRQQNYLEHRMRKAALRKVLYQLEAAGALIPSAPPARPSP